ncbi:hypothetical protein RirG_196880 [Rhizophagus irregularis DAOM 197198w]|uniref:Transposase domain-containing protein n=1 Tax=Rhizophagus irregularis (strain DAOM 197198w) TaxID=1432141 RepID=A0A015IMX8_RHIIW|nr:hypothetical protein RirG_196880 [Rhizophagus irregularis DAOM 197198w]
MELEQHLAYNVSGFVPFLPRNKYDKQAYITPEIEHGLVAERSSSSKKKTEEEPISFDFAVLVPIKGNDKRNRPIDPVDEYEHEYEGDTLSKDDDIVLNDHETPVEQFIVPENDLKFEYPDTNVNFVDSWILIWIFKYQARFRLPDVAIDSLVKFFQQLLMDADKTRFKDFLTSLYTASKLLQIGKQSKTYTVCPSCNTLYNTAEVVAEERFNCTHVEFPMQPKRKPCGMELTEQVLLGDGHKRQPKLLFPLPSLKMQINSLYQRLGFQQQLRKWTNRYIDNGMLADVYDGKIWKNFLDVSNVPYFTPETADSHLGIMINLDWFQPFESSVYSCRAIYGVICNLLREVRFKKENMLILGLLPGPNEVKLHKINYYLFPIVNELLEFWNGIKIPAAGKNIRLALICCSNDIPAARKLCGHVSALVSCHRCYKTSNSNGNGNKSNFGGFDNMDDWFVKKDLEEHRQNAEDWRLCKSEEKRKRHVSSTHVRWSELLRLPYFNPIRHLIVDSMHCLFLGIAHWIIKKLWIDGGKIMKYDLEKMEKRAKTI